MSAGQSSPPAAACPPTPGALRQQAHQRLDEIIAKHTGQPMEKVQKDTERDYFMSSEEAREYSIVDRVIEHH